MILSILAVLTGCGSMFGPKALQQTHPAYNGAIANTVGQEMLQNLVRMRYRDNPNFLQISSVTASLSLESRANINTTIDLGPGGNVVGPGVGITYTDRPTISYSPLQGEDFLKSVMTPISLEYVLVLIQSGWSVARVYGAAVERMNDLLNAPTASGPTPQQEPEYRSFKRMLSLMRQFQNAGDLEIGPDLATQDNDLIMVFERDQVSEATLSELFILLRVEGKRAGRENQDERIRISNNFIDIASDEITMRTRSISSLMFYLSQNVSVPPEHDAAGLVTITKRADGSPFDWNDTPAGSVFRVAHSKKRPPASAIAIPYRGYWFYIADDDLETKTTFLLLMQLFSLQAGQTSSVPPTLTIPVGR
tara:strand:- start:13 stop:1101 length:1089 start_codon:yes stop_codon:yes gene_type:complete